MTRPRGGRSKKTLVKKSKTKTIGGRVKGTKRGSKNRITYVDKSTLV